VLELYPQIKAVHVGAVAISGALFAIRGALVIARRRRLATSAPVRYASYAVDTVLLAAAVMLVAILPPAMFANQWLVAKLALVVVYVALGIVAMRRGSPAFYVAALAAYLAYKGSVAVNGVSLTVNRVEDRTDACSFEINLIPHTLAQTTLPELRAGDAVNLEIDLIARYVARMLGRPEPD